MSEMIERVARALHEELAGGDPDELIHHPAQKSWEAPSWQRWKQWEEAAQAAIAAMREPTLGMIHCGPVTPVTCRVTWTAMIDAALQPIPDKTP